MNTPFNTNRVRGFTTEITLQGDFSTRLEEDLSLRASSTTKDTVFIFFPSHHNGIARGTLCIGIRSCQNRDVDILFHIKVYPYSGKIGIDPVLKVLE